jgi:hypothetical protein
VKSEKPVIKDGSRRTPLPLPGTSLGTSVLLESIRIGFRPRAPVPAYLCLGRDDEATASVEFDRDLDEAEDLREDFRLGFFWVLDEEGVVDLQKNLTAIGSPDLK